jgi:uncharacterized membrane protein
MDIIQHPACTETLCAPSDMQDGSCDSLPVAVTEDEHGYWSVSFWKPTQDDLDVLNDGGTIALWVRAKGRQHPVVGLGVDSWKEEQ